MRHNIDYFLQIAESLKPTDTALGPAIASSDWWQFLGPLWDDMLWMYYADRVVFYNRRFPDDDDETSVVNMLRVWTTYLKSKAHNFERIYNVLWQEYNPLWNVDGVTGTISKDTHTGTDEHKKTGDDTLKMTGTDTNTLSGSDGIEMGGTDSVDVSVTKDDTTRSGNEVLAASGNDVNIKQVTTYDSQDNFLNAEKNTITNGKTDTHTYNNVKDAHELESGTDTTYGKTIDTTYGKINTNDRNMQDKTEYNSTDTDTRNLQDDHIDLVIRQGNIGVTMSQQLLNAELEARKYDFAKMVVKECVNLVTYAVEGI